MISVTIGTRSCDKVRAIGKECCCCASTMHAPPLRAMAGHPPIFYLKPNYSDSSLTLLTPSHIQLRLPGQHAMSCTAVSTHIVSDNRHPQPHPRYPKHAMVGSVPIQWSSRLKKSNKSRWLNPKESTGAYYRQMGRKSCWEAIGEARRVFFEAAKEIKP